MEASVEIGGGRLGRRFRREHIGGGRALKAMLLDGENVAANTILDAETVKNISVANLNAMIEIGTLEVWPVGTAAPLPESDASSQPAGGVELFKLHHGQGRFSVIQGVKLTDEPISGAEADALIAARKDH